MASDGKDDLEDSKSAEVTDKLKVVVCGGGNGAHTFVATISSKPQFEVNWLTLFEQTIDDKKIAEADTINEALLENEGKLKADFVQQKKIIEGKPNIVTNDASKVLSNADIIVLCLPAFGHTVYLKAINKYNDVCNDNENKLNKKLIIASIPSGAGFEFEASKYIKNTQNVIMFNAVTLPWACRILEKGKKVEILGIKDEIDACISANGIKSDKFDPLGTIQSLFIDNIPHLACDTKINMLSSTLGYVNAVVHCPLMYQKWKNYDNDTEFDEKPLFYKAITKEDAQFMTDLSNEVLAIGAKITEAGKAKKESFRGIYVQHVKDTYTKQYAKICDDPSTLHGMFVTNPSYNGLTHPMKNGIKDKNKWIPDFNFRYLTEDVPYGLLIIRSCSMFLDNTDFAINTPVMDQILLWAEKVMNKTYFIKNNDGSIKTVDLNSKDIQRLRIPQNLGFTSIDDVLDF